MTTSPITIKQFHHIAYRCKDAKETVAFYTKYLNMNFMLAIAEDRVPSTKEPDPYMHLFLDAGNGNIFAFFELPNSPEMGKDPNTPEWVQHIALQVENTEQLLEAKRYLEANDIEVIGPTNHEIIQSIYFFDPNGHRLELTAVTATQEMMNALDKVKWSMLDEWSQTKQAPKHAEWLHKKEFVESIEESSIQSRKQEEFV